MKFDIKSDANLRGPVWANAIDRLVGPMFDTNWELYELCISIGMMYDEQIESEDMVPEGYSEEPRYVPRNILIQTRNLELVKFMLKTAIITTSHLDMTEDERLKMALEDDEELSFRPISFLTKYANAGIMKLSGMISDEIMETMDSFTTFLIEVYEQGVNVVPDPAILEDED